MGTLEHEGIEIIPLAPDAALAARLARRYPPGGLFTLLLRRLPGGRRIVDDHTSS